MNPVRSLVSGIQALFQRDRRNFEMDEELRSYLEAATEENMRRGMSRAEAVQAARIEMGTMETVKHKVWSAGWESTADSIWQDIRYGARQLLKSPGFSIVAILSLALGIGANTAIFTLIDNLLLKSLPVHNPSELTNFGLEVGGGTIDGIGPGPLDIFPYEFFKQIEKQSGPFQSVTAFASFPTSVNIRFSASGSGPATQAVSHLVAGNFFSVLGAEPILGRTISAADADAPGRSPVAVLSYRYWQQALSADPAVIGRSITINGTLFNVVGVMPQNFYGIDLNAESPDMWLPLTMQQEVTLQPSLLNPHGFYFLHMMGRRAPHTSLAQTQAWVTAQLQRYMTDREGAEITNDRRGEIRQIYVQMMDGSSGISNLRAAYAQPLKILMVVVVLVLLIACANLANFLVAKAAAREREVSTRLALGSSRSRIVRQILTETLLLSFTGGALGLLLAFLGSRMLIHFVVAGAAHTALTPDPNLRVLAFTFGISICTGLLFGIAPALRVSRITVGGALSANTRTASVAGASTNRVLPKFLVTAQVMFSIILLAGAGLFLKTLRNLENQNLGFNRTNVLLVRFNPKFAGYKPEQLNALYDRILTRIDALPGVRSATISGAPPMSQSSWNGAFMEAGHVEQPHEDLMVTVNRVAPHYFETIGIPLVKGRTIEDKDTATSVKAVVINETLANHAFPKGDAVGRRVQVTVVDDVWQVVGVVKDSKIHGLRETKPTRMAYLALSQVSGDNGYAYWLQILAKGDPTQITSEVRSALTGIDPNLPPLEVKSIAEQLDRFTDQERLISNLCTFFSLLALALACIGLYGVMTYNVVRRTNEIGIRIALGAQTNGVLWMILKESLLLLAIGIALGIPATLLAGRAVQSQLFGLTSSDPSTLLISISVIVAVTLAAAYFPARRATHIDPMVALRYE